MPFCNQCGTKVADIAAFCQSCGARQPGAGDGTGAGAVPPGPAADPLSGIKPQTASMLCYIPWIGWILSLVVLSTRRFRTDTLVRFHAFQGLYLFVAWLIVDMVLEPMLGVRELRRMIVPMLKLSLVGTAIFMMLKTANGEFIRLPIIGEWADRSVAEQSTGGRF